MGNETKEAADDLSAIKRLARKATPGPWKVESEYVNGIGESILVAGTHGETVCEFAGSDADYIASVSPDAVERLIARVNAAESQVSAVRKVRDGMREALARLDVTDFEGLFVTHMIDALSDALNTK